MSTTSATDTKVSAKTVSAPESTKQRLAMMKNMPGYVIAGQPGSLTIEEGERKTATVLKHVGELDFAPNSKRADESVRKSGFFGVIFLVKTSDGITGTIVTGESELPETVELMGQRQGKNVNAVIVG